MNGDQASAAQTQRRTWQAPASGSASFCDRWEPQAEIASTMQAASMRRFIEGLLYGFAAAGESPGQEEFKTSSRALMLPANARRNRKGRPRLGLRQVHRTAPR